jgi:transposase
LSIEDPFELRSQALGALPIVDHFLARLRVGELLERYLPAGGLTRLADAAVIGVLVRNLCLAREPLYAIADWARRFDPAALGLAAGDAEALNDDRVGRALDALFDCDRGSLLVELVLAAIAEFEIDCSQLHNDSTSFAVHGAYPTADGRARAGKPTPRITFGHSKDHRPDLKQLVWILTVAADGAVPLAHRLADGNTADQSTHVQTWDGLCALVGRADFLYVADCKLATREQMGHIDERGGRFVTILPRSRCEDARLREWTRAGGPHWSEAARAPGRRRRDPDDVWSVAAAPIRSAEGYRLVWVHSTRKQQLDEQARSDRAARATRALDALNARLTGPKCRFRERDQVHRAARTAIAPTHAAHLISFDIEQRTERRIREESRGPGRKPARRRIVRERFTLRYQLDERAVADEAACDGCFPLISNDDRLPAAELLAAYRYQPNLEKRHHQLKHVQHAAPILLKSPARIEALFTCHFIALLCTCLIERELRSAMRRQQVQQLALYPEQRDCRAPTAARVLDLFADTARHRLLRDGALAQAFDPQLTALQRHVLELLAVPPRAYRHARTA